MSALLLAACSDASFSTHNNAPTVSIARPSDGEDFDPLEPVQLCAEVGDESEVGSLEFTVQSDVDGLLATEPGEVCDVGNVGWSVTLSDADHVVSVLATDPQGASGSASIELEASPNEPPSCSISAPLDGASFELGDTITFTAKVDDDATGPESLAASLDSSLDGNLWSGNPDSVGGIRQDVVPVAPGDTELRLTLTDGRGLVNDCFVSIYVDPCLDEDGDGWSTCDGDCDDADASSYPGGVEDADGADNDCNGTADDGTALVDDDGDGYTELDDDCDDGDASVNPGAEETWYDGVDQDCDGNDDDQDGDGYAVADDCDDTDAAVNPDAAETWYDGVDQDCDGNDDDQDADGWPVDADCDDTDAAISPEAAEAWYDGVDQDCDGNDTDQDGDGYDVSTDCDDTDASVFPGASETWYDGVDSDCDGANDYDQDGDGYTAEGFGGSDCQDGDASVHPGAEDTWYDGEDTDCDDASDYDQDGDGYDADAWGGDDCDDTDDAINPGAAESWYDGVDQDCDGASDDDQDGDGYDAEAEGGTDCDDTDSAVHPGASESRNAADDDCDGGCDEGLIDPGDLVITEVMKDPNAVGDTSGEWFEVYNDSGADIRMCGWVVEDADSDSFTMNAEVLVPAGGYAVFGRDTSTATNGGVTVDYNFASGMQLGNGNDEIILYEGGTEIDRVEYDDGVDWPDPTGSSISLDPTKLDASDNDDGANWCDASSSYGSGDKGTPGSANDPC
jgi:hypothetical protein